MGEAIRSALALAAKDLRLEFRTRTALVSALMFAVLTLLVFVFATLGSAIGTYLAGFRIFDRLFGA